MKRLLSCVTLIAVLWSAAYVYSALPGSCDGTLTPTLHICVPPQDQVGVWEEWNDFAQKTDQHAATTTNVHGATPLNVAGRIVSRDASGNFAAGIITGNLSGNATTATALATNPSDCPNGQFARAIDARGNLTCAAGPGNSGGGNSGITSFGLSMPSEFGVANSPVTVSGTTIVVTKASQVANSVYAGPTSGGAAAPTFRALTDNDIPDDITIDVGGDLSGFAAMATVAKITGLTVSTTPPTDGQVLKYVSGAGQIQWQDDAGASGAATSFDQVTAGTNTGNALVIGNSSTLTTTGTGVITATTATALAANPTDCTPGTFATAIAANGNLTCAALSDSDIPNNITITMSGDVTGTAGASTVAKLLNRALSTTPPTNGQALVFNSGTGEWVPTTISGSVTSVFGRTGAVVATAGDYTASQIANVPFGGIASTTVQNAINELDTEKLGVAGNAATATALAVNPADCAANQFAQAIAANGNLTCAAISDADIPDTITASNYLLLTGGTLSGQLVVSNLGIEFTESDTNPTCVSGNYNIYADLSEGRLKKCENGTVTDFAASTPSFSLITGGTNTSSAMVVGTGASLGVSGSGTITATSFATNPTDCAANQFANAIASNGNLTCAGIVDADVPNTITVNIAGDVTGTTLAAVVSKIQGTAVIATPPTDGYVLKYIAANSRAEWQPDAGASGAATSFDLLTSGTNLGSTLVVGNGTTLSATGTGTIAATTAVAFAANPADCAGGTFATTIAANGTLTCAAITDSDVPDTITVNLGGDLTGTAAAATVAKIRGRTVATTAPTNGQVYAYNTGTGQWEPTSIAGSVTSVFGRSGAVVSASGDYTASQITNVAAGNISSTTVQAALNELDSEKLATSGNAATASALASNPSDCSANTFATAIAANGNLTCSSLVDADVPDTITASNYVALAGSTMTGQLVVSGQGIEFTESDSNPTCAAGNYNIYSDTSELKLKKCMNGVVSDLDTGGVPAFSVITNGTNTTAAMVVGTGASLGVTGSGTITATTLAADPANCSAGNAPLGVSATGAVQSCFDVVTQTEGDAHFNSTSNPHSTTLQQAYDASGATPTINAAAHGVTVDGLTSTNAQRFCSASDTRCVKFYDDGSANMVMEASPANDLILGAPSSHVIKNQINGTDALKIDASRIVSVNNFYELPCIAPGTTITTGNGKCYLTVPQQMNGMVLSNVNAHVVTASSSGVVSIALTRCSTVATGNSCSGTTAAMLSTNLTIDANESKSATAATPAVINTANDDLSTDQVIRVDISSAGTGAAGLFIRLETQLQ